MKRMHNEESESMIDESMLKWHKKYVNNIETNPIECLYCIIDYGDGNGRMYRIQAMRKADYNGRIEIKDGYKYFLFFESYVKKADTEILDGLERNSYYLGYQVESETLIQIYDSMEDAKRRAYVQYYAIYGYCLSEAGDDVEEMTKTHFVV